jgi:hypothetical protein
VERGADRHGWIIIAASMSGAAARLLSLILGNQTRAAGLSL